MSVLAELLGDKILGKNGDKEVAELAGEGKVVGLYFSAHWCPPCRAFTPQLATWYKKFKDGENGSMLEIVFVSSDRNQEGFDEYYKEMPWPALSYEQRDKKNALSKKFKVTGIPTLIMLNGQTGKVISADGRSIVADDPEGLDFPWTPKGFIEVFNEAPLIADQSGKEVKWSDVKVTHVGLYFSAHWCGPCRTFTPQLIDTYKILNEDEKKFEIIFVSSDKDEEAFDEYYSEMPWLAFKFTDDRKKTLSRIFDVSGIPTLIILDVNTRETVTGNGRGAIESDPLGQQFPWYPKPVEELKAYTAAAINEQPALVWLTDESEEQSKKALEMMTPIATEYFEEVTDLDADEKLAFLYSGPSTGQDDIGGSLRGFLKIPTDRKPPILFATNIPDQEKYISEDKEITPEVIQRIVTEFKTKQLEWQPIQ